MARLVLVIAIGAIVWGVVSLHRRDVEDLERTRATLLSAVRAARASLVPEDESAARRAESWLIRSSGTYEGDFIAAELRPPGALAAVLARPAVYVRGALGQMNNSQGIAVAAAISLKDPFLVCLVNPPVSRTETALLAKVRDAYSSAAEQHSPNVRRLRDAQVGLPFLMPPWSDKIRSAKNPEELDLLRSEFEKAPIEGAKRAAKAELLVFAMDEPDDAGAPAELDGERPHFVRVGLVDLVAAKVLLRTRKPMDPSWISVAKRSLYAGGVDGCALAFDARASVTLKN